MNILPDSVTETVQGAVAVPSQYEKGTFLFCATNRQYYPFIKQMARRVDMMLLKDGKFVPNPYTRKAVQGEAFHSAEQHQHQLIAKDAEIAQLKEQLLVTKGIKNPLGMEAAHLPDAM